MKRQLLSLIHWDDVQTLVLADSPMLRMKYGFVWKYNTPNPLANHHFSHSNSQFQTHSWKPTIPMTLSIAVFRDLLTLKLNMYIFVDWYIFCTMWVVYEYTIICTCAHIYVYIYTDACICQVCCSKPSWRHQQLEGFFFAKKRKKVVAKSSWKPQSIHQGWKSLRPVRRTTNLPP